jgi:hypothetical protein
VISRTRGLSIAERRVDAGTVPALAFDIQLNPLITFNVYLPFMVAAAYPGGAATVQSDYTEMVRRAAQVRCC